MDKRSGYVYEGLSEAYEKYVKWSDEKEVIGRALIRLIRPDTNMRLLDVGAGYGDLTSKISNLFVHIDVVEPHNQMYYKLKKVLCDSHIKLYPVPFEQVDLDPNTYDVVLCSHALDYMEDYATAVAKIIEYTTPGGMIILIVNSEHGEYFNLKSAFEPRFRPGIDYSLSSVSEKNRSIRKLLNKSCNAVTEEDLMSSVKIPFVKDILPIAEYFFDVKMTMVESALQQELTEYLLRFKKGSSITLQMQHRLYAAIKKQF